VIDESVVLDDEEQQIEQQHVSFEQPGGDIHSFSEASSRQPHH
jgi:hypothetical protein